jgi:hypothetical protein
MDSTLKAEVVARLTGVRTLLADPNAWCQGANARSADGLSTGVRHPKACRFCLNGALLKVSYDRGGNDDEPAWRKSRDLIEACCIDLAGSRPGFITDTNDRQGMTHETILKIIDCSVAKANALDVEEPVQA